jgi:hypothetical protein
MEQHTENKTFILNSNTHTHINLQARGLLEEGLMWRVGNGEKIRIWGDNWLPSPNSNLLYNPHQRLDVDARVCNLLDLTSG